MLTLIYAANGNQAQRMAEKLRKENLGDEFHVRQINAYCGKPEKCDKLIMLDPSAKIEGEHKHCEIIREYNDAKDTKRAPSEPTGSGAKAPAKRGRKPRSQTVS